MGSVIVAVIPILLKLLDLILNKVNASAEAKRLMQELIRLSKNDGLISVANSDKEEEHRKNILDQIEKDKNKV